MPGGGSLNPSTHETVDKKMHYVHQDGQAVFKFAVRKQTELCERLLERETDLRKRYRRLIPQSGEIAASSWQAPTCLGLKPEMSVINIDRFGNTTAGTIPLAMDTARQEGKLEKGSLVMLASVGAGFTVSAALLRWTY